MAVRGLATLEVMNGTCMSTDSCLCGRSRPLSHCRASGRPGILPSGPCKALIMSLLLRIVMLDGLTWARGDKSAKGRRCLQRQPRRCQTHIQTSFWVVKHIGMDVWSAEEARRQELVFWRCSDAISLTFSTSDGPCTWLRRLLQNVLGGTSAWRTVSESSKTLDFSCLCTV
jgi:hypothetical protein